MLRGGVWFVSRAASDVKRYQVVYSGIESLIQGRKSREV